MKKKLNMENGEEVKIVERVRMEGKVGLSRDCIRSLLQVFISN